MTYSQRKATGRRALMVWIPAELHRKLRIAAVTDEVTMEDLVVVALKNLLDDR